MVELERYYGLARYRVHKVLRVLEQAGKTAVDRHDLVQVALVGLVEARNRYDPGRGAKFATFAMPRIDGAIKDYLRKLDPLTQREREKVRQLDRVRADLIADIRRQPSTDELAQALAISAEEVMKIEALRIIVIPLETPTNPHEHGEGQTLWEFPDPTHPPPESELTRKRLAEDVNDCLEGALDPVERQVLTLRVLGALTLQKTGDVLGMSSAETVRRREQRAKMRLRQCLETKGWEVTDILEILP